MQSRPLDGDRGRQTTLADVEEAIASRWWRKDAALEIGGLAKEPLGTWAGFAVVRVDSEWIRDNLDTTFGTGGHGLVHTFIPLKEIWIDPVKEQPSTLIFHEIVEFTIMMEGGMSYWVAHQLALRRQAGRVITLTNLELHLNSALGGR